MLAGWCWSSKCFGLVNVWIGGVSLLCEHDSFSIWREYIYCVSQRVILIELIDAVRDICPGYRMTLQHVC